MGVRVLEPKASARDAPFLVQLDDRGPARDSEVARETTVLIGRRVLEVQAMLLQEAHG